MIRMWANGPAGFNSRNKAEAYMGNYFESMFGNKLRAMAGALIAFLSTIYSMAIGGEEGFVVALIGLAVVSLYLGDLVLGVGIAIRRGCFSSRGFSRTLEKLFVYTLSLVGMTSFGVLLSAAPYASGIEVSPEVIVNVAKMFFIWCLLLIGFTEFVSVVENLKKLGFQLPAQILVLAQRLRERLATLPPTQFSEEDGHDDGSDG